MMAGKLVQTDCGRWNPEKELMVNPVCEDQRDPLYFLVNLHSGI